MTDQELETVVTYVKDRLFESMPQASSVIPDDYFRLAERIVRVEEALKNLSLLMEKRFEAVDKRFEDMNKRFEDMIHLMDKRFEDMNMRFDAIDRRFNWMIGIMTVLITGLGVLITIYRFLGPAAAG